MATVVNPSRFFSLCSGMPRPARKGAFVAAARPRRSSYEVLRVTETASAAEIRAAYRAMAKKVHPDVSSSALAAATGDGAAGVEEFVEVRRAYEELSDPVARAMLDDSVRRRRGIAAAAAAAPAGGPAARSMAFRQWRWETDQCV